MNTFFFVMLFIFWTMFGSFASVIIYRLKSWEWWIFGWRSHCKTCERNLSVIELIPIFSWLFQWGKCKGCSQKIDWIYPLLELTMWVLFTAVWYFLISPELIFEWSLLEILKLDFFLGVIFLSFIYIFYDILYLEIPESILIFLNVLILSFLWIEILTAWLFDARVVFFEWMNYTNGWEYLIEQFVLAWIIIWWLYLIMLAWLREVYDIAILISLWLLLIWANAYFQSWYPSYIFESPLVSGLFWAMALFSFFFMQIVISGWKWMWGWDLRIAIAMGLLVWIHFAFPAWMITYLVGSFIGIWIIIISRYKKWSQTNFSHQIPFWPFLACWYLSVLFFYPQITQLIEMYF